MISKHIREYGFDLRLNTSMKEIIGDSKGRVKSIITDKDEEIKCEVVGLTAGVSPNISWLKDTKIKCDRGVIIDKNMQTNLEDVYAAGDCTPGPVDHASGTLIDPPNIPGLHHTPLASSAMPG